MVILDNHMSDADWCCSYTDGNGLWYTANYSEAQWISIWQQVVQRYANNPYVIGCDLRNELRITTINYIIYVPSWGDGVTATDWRAAAQRGGNAILSINPNLLIFVEGTNSGTDLSLAVLFPVVLNVPNKLVYSAHSYANGITYPDYLFFETAANYFYGYIILAKAYPVWIGEFGTCNTGSTCFEGFFEYAIEYFQNYDYDTSYWPWDGTQSTGTTRVFGSVETYGIMNTTWNGPSNTQLLNYLQSIQSITQGSPNGGSDLHSGVSWFLLILSLLLLSLI